MNERSRIHSHHAHHHHHVSMLDLMICILLSFFLTWSQFAENKNSYSERHIEVPLVPLSNLTVRFSLTCVQSAPLPVLLSSLTRAFALDEFHLSRVSRLSLSFFALFIRITCLVAIACTYSFGFFLSPSLRRLLSPSQSTLPCNELHFCLFFLTSLFSHCRTFVDSRAELTVSLNASPLLVNTVDWTVETLSHCTHTHTHTHSPTLTHSHKILTRIKVK